jgi:hypothetical protein
MTKLLKLLEVNKCCKNNLKEPPENPQKSRECMLKNLRVGDSKKLKKMKKLVLLFAAICLLSAGNAQTMFEQGKIMVGVSSTLKVLALSDDWYINPGSDFLSIGFGSYKYSYASGSYSYDSKYKLRGLNLLPKTGYFVIDNLAVGLDVIFSNTTWIDADDDEKWITNLLCAGPYARYYYPMEKFSPFAEVNAAIGILSDKNIDDGDTDVEKNSIITFGGGVGAAFPLGERVTFDVMAGYSFLSCKEKASDEESNGESGTSKITSGMLGIRMGFSVFFNKK